MARDAGAFPEPKDEGPDLRFESYSWNFGSVYQGDAQEYAFKCRNVGGKDLVISKVETSCGDCLVPLARTETIPPGGEGAISVLLNTTGQTRALGKKLYVASNDPITPVVPLDVVGYVKPLKLVTSPRAVSFGEHRRSETAHELIYIPSLPEEKIEVKSVSSDSPFVDVAFAETKDYVRPGYIVMVGLKPGGAPLGKLEGTITIVSDHPRNPKAEVPVTAAIKGDIDLDRNSFFFGLLKKGDQRKSTITISTVGGEPLRIDKMDNPADYIELDLQPITDGKAYLLTATLNGKAPTGNIKQEIVIHTNNDDQAEIRVPVYAYVEGS
ncbi:MAG: hypothetical protein A2Z18_10760 [Armatimonadetes bacterium RBG_16_58_9]|nr:MAG: hypothetical protein A2Z18_10760 [Armatimonadetes bacterium RBG_16_58_9]